MRVLASLCLVACLLFPATGCRDGAGADPVQADLIMTGGQVLTLTDAEADAGVRPTAVAMSDGRIVYVGDDAGARRYSGDLTRAIDLKGKFVVPGFNDSHCHLYGLGKALAEINLNGTISAEDVVSRVASATAEVPGDGWLQGRGWDQNDWPVQEYPDRELLDEVTGSRPALLRRVDGHAAWANSAALELAGISNDTADPAGGAIIRNRQGRPTGILVDNAVDLVREVIPEPEPAEVERRILLAIDHCLQNGITGVHTAGVSWRRVQLYRELDAAGKLGLRVYGMLDDKPEALEPGLAHGPILPEDGFFTLRAVKLYADGALGSRGALLLDDYQDRPGHRGLPVTGTDHMAQVARQAGRAGFQICTHAIGDGANRVVLDMYAEILGELALADARWRIEHAQILAPADIPRFVELGVIAAMQPVHCTSDMDWADERLGTERLAGCYAWRSLVESGAHLCWGTDFPVEAVSPLAGLYSARTRTHADGTPIGGWQPQECLDGLTALELYTAGSAYAEFREDDMGRIAPGFVADLTVLDGDPVGCADGDLLSMQIEMTVVDGKVAYLRH